MDNPSFPEQMGYGAWLERPEHRNIYHDAEAEKAIFGEDGLTFESLLDALNPLHHIPIVNSIYRELTGDTIAPGPSLVGGFLFGGVLGAVGSVASTALESVTGNNLAGHVMTALRDGDEAAPGAGRDDGKGEATVTIGEITLAGDTGMADAANPTIAIAPGASTPGASTPGGHDSASDTAEASAAGQPFTASAAGSEMFRARPQAEPPAPAAAMDSPANPDNGLAAFSNARAEDMPELSADLDAKLRHAQKALAASGLVAAGDEALQSRIGTMLGNESAVPPPPAAQEAVSQPVPQAVPQAATPEAAPQEAAARTADPSGAAVAATVSPVAAPAAERHFMPLDNGGRTRRWYGLGTAEILPAAAIQTPQSAAQALASRVYRQQAEALQQGTGHLDLSY